MTGRLAALLLAGATLAAAASLATSASAGEPPSTIAVLCEPGDRFGLRVLAELESLGFRAVILDPEAAPASRASLEASAREAGAIAAIRAIPSERGVEVWIADRVTGKTVLREMVSGDVSPDRDAALALRAVELLRASLLEVTLPAPLSGEVAATPEIARKMQLPPPAALAVRPFPALRLSLAPGLLLSPGGFGGSGSLVVDLAWMPGEHVGVSGFAAIPLGAAEIDGSQGSARLAVLLAGGAVRFVLAPRGSPWSPSADLGVMAVSLTSTGTANQGFVSSAPSAATAAPFARLGLAFAMTPLLRLRADVLASGVFEGVSVELAEHEVATWGRPVVLSSLGLDLVLF